MSRSNSPGARLRGAVEHHVFEEVCEPVMPGTSLRLPTRTQL
jgi:hypothetical protein